jgi:hypothetical protein
MPKPLPSTYPKHQRWRFIQRATTSGQLVSFANALVDSNNTNLDQSLPDILHFVDPQNKDISSLKHEWLSIWVNIMHQGGLGYTVTSKARDETRVIATDLSRYVADTKNTAAYYYYWALRFQYPFTFPKHNHYIKNNVAVQPVVLICQYIDWLEKMQGNLKEAYLSKYEIAQFLMKSTGHAQSVIRNNCTEIIANRNRTYNYEIERQNREFKEAAEHLFSRGRLFIGNFNLLTFLSDRITVRDADTLAKLRAFLSYRSNPFIFKENSQDVRNEFFLDVYSDLDPDPDILYENVNGKIQNFSGTRPKKAIVAPQTAIKVVNPQDMRGTFGTGTRGERKFQQQLRRDMLSMYNGRCCVCGLDRQEFLVASHIVAVNIDPSIAADRRNCLLLCVLHDRALEKGYFGLLDDCTIIANRDKSLRHPVLVREITKREGQRIHLPQDQTLCPLTEYLRRHRIAHGISSQVTAKTLTSYV